MAVQAIGVIGLGTMGANLARNAARRGVKVAVYNRTTEKMHDFIKHFGKEGSFVPCKTLEELVRSVGSPGVILLMVNAGNAVDAVITELAPLVVKGDIIIDGGNSHFADTERRVKELKDKGIRFLGMGVSGGEEGALNGPSMMPGGDASAYKDAEELLQEMAADDGIGGKCVSYMGPGGSGHFVKMVHNGIEYGVMQLLAETYDIFRTIGAYTNEQLAETYSAWNAAPELRSFLVEITAQIFQKKDGSGYLIDLIKDAAGQKGTGKWTTFAALDLGIAIPTINASVDARVLSGNETMRRSGTHLPAEPDEQEPMPKPEHLRSMVRSAYELSMICCYEQGFELIKAASAEANWNVNLSEVARIWRGGCIVRSAYLAQLQSAFGSDPAVAQAAKEYILERFRGGRQKDWRILLELTVSRGVPTPALSASLNYFDSYRNERLPQNLIQAQRDFFGAHTFERTDREGTFHADWNT